MDRFGYMNYESVNTRLRDIKLQLNDLLASFPRAPLWGNELVYTIHVDTPLVRERRRTQWRLEFDFFNSRALATYAFFYKWMTSVESRWAKALVAMIGLPFVYFAGLKRSNPYQQTNTDIFRYFLYNLSCLWRSNTVRRYQKFNDLIRNFERMKVEPNSQGKVTAVMASDHLEKIVNRSNLVPYFRQMSAADQRKGRIGDRFAFWDTDLEADLRQDDTFPGDVDIMIDVDCHVPMEIFLLKHDRPILLYTLQPRVTAYECKEYSLSCKDDVFRTVYAGATYEHKVWDYSKTHISAAIGCGGVVLQSRLWRVFRKFTELNHALVLLVPMLTASGNSQDGINGTTYHCIDRMKVSTGDYNILKMHETDVTKVHVSRAGSHVEAVVDEDIHTTLLTLARNQKHGLHMPTVLSYLDGNRVAAAIAHDYYSHCSSDPDPIRVDLEDAIRSYQLTVDDYDPDAKHSLTSFMPPIVHGAFAPDVTKENEVAAVQGRVENVRPPPDLKMPVDIARYVQEFAQLLIDDRESNSLDPVGYDVVFDRQDKPTQRRILESTAADEPYYSRVVKMFIKKEAYGNVKDPRIISTICGPDKAEYSTYMYALEPILKRNRWYAFGKSCAAISQRIVEICSSAQSVVNTDFSRFDGHVSWILREFESTVALRAFRPQHAARLTELLLSQQNLKGIGPLGTKYATGDSRLSGSPETSLFNTMDNAFIAYCAKRRSGLDSAASWNALGIYGGDDGLTADITSEVYATTARDVGQELTVEVKKRNEYGVAFLARHYSKNVWDGDHSSMCDLPRQLSKFHTTVNLPPNYTPEMKLVEKARCFILNDKFTPILGDYCRKVVDLGAHITSDEILQDALTSWTVKESLSTGSFYENALTSRGWMEEWTAILLPEFDRKTFDHHLSKATSLRDLLNFPLCMAPIAAKSATPAVVSGEVVAPLVDTRTVKVRNETKRPLKDHKEEKSSEKKDRALAERKKKKEEQALVAPVATIPPEGKLPESILAPLPEVKQVEPPASLQALAKSREKPQPKSDGKAKQKVEKKKTPIKRDGRGNKPNIRGNEKKTPPEPPSEGNSTWRVVARGGKHSGIERPAPQNSTPTTGAKRK